MRSKNGMSIRLFNPGLASSTIIRFDLPTLQQTLSASRSSQLINSLHSILRPFLLRRLKVDVEASLPPKKEYVLYAPLSESQRGVYDAIVSGQLRALLVKQAGERAGTLQDGAKEESEEDEPLAKAGLKDSRREGLRNGRRRDYARDEEEDDEVYFKRLESGEPQARERRQKKEQTIEEIGREWQYKSTCECFLRA